MKITTNLPTEKARMLVGRLSPQGTIFLRFSSHHAPTQKTVTMNGSHARVPTTVVPNGTDDIDGMTSLHPIYEGDEITIKF